jgi:D-alanyl-D-alanine carboxypeptidase
MIRSFLAPFVALSLGASAPRTTVDTTAIAAALDAIKAPGTILIARGDKIVFERAFGRVDPQKRAEHRLGQVWRWASVTKQITATIAMQEVAAGRLDLDTPIIRYLPDSKAPFAKRITSRMLMQHISGLPRTEEGRIGADGWSQFYMVDRDSPETGRAYCEGPTTREPLSGFYYGDCDFIVMAAIIEATSGKSYDALIAERIAQPLRLTSVGLFPTKVRTVAGYAEGKPESSAFRLENFGAAGALYGTTRDLLAPCGKASPSTALPPSDNGRSACPSKTAAKRLCALSSGVASLVASCCGTSSCPISTW